VRKGTKARCGRKKTKTKTTKSREPSISPPAGELATPWRATREKKSMLDGVRHALKHNGNRKIALWAFNLQIIPSRVKFTVRLEKTILYQKELKRSGETWGKTHRDCRT